MIHEPSYELFVLCLVCEHIKVRFMVMAWRRINSSNIVVQLNNLKTYNLHLCLFAKTVKAS